MANNSYQDYIHAIGFRFWQPMTQARGVRHLRAALNTFGLQLDAINTRLPAPHTADTALRRLGRIPRMSTIGIAAMINRGVALMPQDQCYVNVGVWNGYTLLAGMVGNSGRKSIGVDNFSQFGGPRDEFLKRFEQHRGPLDEFHDLDYEEYFANHHRTPIGFYFYDGEHSYENQLKGLQVAEPFFSPGCRILIDDTNIPAARDAMEDFRAASARRYEVLLDKPTSRNLHPALWNGVIVLERVA